MRNKKKYLEIIKIVYYLLWFPYLSVILWLTFFNRESTSPRFELTPFWEYTYLFTGTSYERRYYFQQIRDNILLFVPFGFMLPTIFKKYRYLKSTFLTALLFSVSIELLQLITARGLCEFDDVFNNTLGAVIGYLLYKIIERIMYGKNFSMQDKKEVYAALKSRLKKAIKNEFWFEACMIEYALIEDRSSSILYHAGIFGIEAYSEKKSSPINFVPLIIRLERNIRLFLKKFRKSLLQIFLCGKNSEMLLYIVLVSENMMKKK